MPEVGSLSFARKSVGKNAKQVSVRAASSKGVRRLRAGGDSEFIYYLVLLLVGSGRFPL